MGTLIIWFGSFSSITERTYYINFHYWAKINFRCFHLSFYCVYAAYMLRICCVYVAHMLRICCVYVAYTLGIGGHKTLRKTFASLYRVPLERVFYDWARETGIGHRLCGKCSMKSEPFAFT